MGPAQAQDLRADGNRDRYNAVEDVKDDLVGVLRMRRQVYLRTPHREHRRHPLDPVQELAGVADDPERRDRGRELGPHRRSNLIGR